MSEDGFLTAKLEEIATRALAFQRYVFRRAWGTYYALWAAAFVVFVFSPELPLQSLAPASYSWVPYATVYGGVGWAAGIATAFIFKSAHRTLFLRKIVETERPTQGRGFAFMWIWWLAFYLVVLISFFFIPSEALSVLYALLFSVEIFIYYALKLAFQNKTPLEGKLALISYGICDAFSFFASLFAKNLLPFEVAWGITIAVWLFCGLYALRRAPEELEALMC